MESNRAFDLPVLLFKDIILFPLVGEKTMFYLQSQKENKQSW